jgi:hypothetical protein
MYTHLHYIADVKSLHLPEILKPGLGFRGTPRRLYAVLSIEDSPNYVMSLLDSKAYMNRPMTL